MKDIHTPISRKSSRKYNCNKDVNIHVIDFNILHNTDILEGERQHVQLYSRVIQHFT